MGNLVRAGRAALTAEGAESEAKEKMNEIDARYKASEMWAVSGDNYFPCEKTEKKLKSGQYIINYSDQKGIFFTKKTINLDKLLVLPDSKSEVVLASIDNFWNREEKFREHGFLWKRGIMLWGPPGSGKTVLCQQLAAQIVKRGGISVYMSDPAFTAEGLRVLRTIESDRPIVVMIEDIDSIVERKGEAQMLALLDGELQIDNVVFVATTNYPERLDKRLVNRPSRFDEIIYIGMPSADARRKYIVSKNPRLNDALPELEKWVKGTDGLSIAHIREIIIAVECLGNDLDKTMLRVAKMNKAKPNSDSSDDKGGFGFTE